MTDERLRLVAELQNKASAELRRLTKDLDKVKPNGGMIAARRWMDDFRNAGQKAAEVTRPLPGMFSALGVGGVAAGLSIGEMVKQFRDLAAELPRLRELGRQSGMAETDIKRLAYAARMLNADGDKMGSAIGTWSGKMVEFRKHTGTLYTEMLRQNSDLAKKIQAESPAEGFKDMLGWIARIPDAARKAGYSAADAVQIQKRYLEEATGSDDLMPMLAKGAQGLADAYAEANKNVAPITPELEKQADALNRSLAQFDQTWANFKTEVGPAIFDQLTKATDDFRSVFASIKQAQSWLQEHKEHPVGDAAQAVGDSFDQHAKDAGDRYRGQKPWGFGLPKTWSDDLGLTDPKQQWTPDSGYWISMKGIADGLKKGLGYLNPIGSAHAEESSHFGVGLGENDRETRARATDLLPSSSAAKKDTADAVKAGTLAAWREMAQQEGVGGGQGVGAPSIRYGRGADGQFRRGGHGGGGRNFPDTPDGAGHAENVKGGMGMRALAAMKYLVEKKGWTPEGASIAIGNAIQESSVSPNASGDPSVPGGSHHMFQWNRGRLAAFRAFAGARGKSVLDFETNLDFFDQERKQRSGLEQSWDKQKDLKNAGRLGHLFEGYGDNSEGTRVQNARNMLDLWKKQHPGAYADGGQVSGPGGPRSDSIFARLSDGEFVVNAKAAGEHAGLLEAINSGRMPAFADGGRVGSWMGFFRRSDRQGGMGAPLGVARAAVAMMQGESGRGLNASLYGWDVNGPSGGTAQWHDVTKGRNAGKVHRLSDLMAFAMSQHADWRDVGLQQAWWKHEAKGPLSYAWKAMMGAHSATAALRAGINKFEVPADKHGEFMRRLPNLVRLARQDAQGSASGSRSADLGGELHVHLHEGRVRRTEARSNGGLKLHVRSNPTMVATGAF